MRHAVTQVVAWTALAAVPLTAPARRTSQPTAELSGIVLNGITGEPVPDALVHVERAGGGGDRPVTADRTGRFTADRLPAGTYHVTARAIGFFAGAAGQTVYRGPDRPVLVEEATRVADVSVSIWPPGSIHGVVRDTGGASIVASVVLFHRAADWDERWIPVETRAPAVTDEAGRYQMDGLEPALYVVAAAPPSATLTRTGFTPTFAPGSPHLSDAVPIAVASGETRDDGDIAVRLRPRITITGHLVGPAPLIGQATVRLCPSDEGTRASGLCQAETVSADDGSYALTGAVGGTYLLEAVTPGLRADDRPLAWGRRAAAIGDGDVDGADIPMAPTSSVTGQLVLDKGAALPDGLTVSLTVLDPFLMPPGGPKAQLLRAAVDHTGRFTMRGLLPGEYLFTDDVGLAGWTLISALVGGQDGADDPFTVSPDVALPEAALHVAAATTTVRGTVRTAVGEPADRATVILFAVEPRFWHPSSRRVRSAETERDGTFTITGLPAGEYYLSALPDRVDHLSGVLLDRVLPGSQTIHVNMGQVLTSAVTLGVR